MNKSVINSEIGYAYDALQKSGIASEDKKINKAYRGQISTFGAAVQMGSLKAAIAFFMKDASADSKNSQEVHRSKLLEAILLILKEKDKKNENYETLYDYVCAKNEEICREEIINASIALKLAMNLYVLTDGR